MRVRSLLAVLLTVTVAFSLLGFILPSGPALACAASAPHSLTATPQGDGSVRLDWMPPQNLAGLTLDGYYIFRATKSGNYNWSYPRNDFMVTGTSWVDTECQPGQTYYYKVKAYFTNKDHSGASNEVQFTAGGQDTIVLVIGNPVALVGGRPVPLDQPPVIIGSRTLIPLRFIMENFKAAVDWDPKGKVVKAVFGNTKVILVIGSYTAKVNGVDMEIDVPPVIVNDRTLVPVRFLTTAFGWKVDWDHITQTVTINIVEK